MVNRLPGLLIKQPEEQEVAQDTQRQCCICYHGLFDEVGYVVNVLQSN